MRTVVNIPHHYRVVFGELPPLRAVANIVSRNRQSFRHLPSAFCLFIALALMPYFAAAQARFGSGPLNRSVQNEADAAVDRAVSWLVAEQSAEGNWGTTNVKTTAVCAIAVRGDRSEFTREETNCLKCALAWLRERDATNGWGAVAIGLLDGKFDGDVSGVIDEFMAHVDTNDVAAAFVSSVARKQKTFDVHRLAMEWVTGLGNKWYDDPEYGWWLARSINVASCGELQLPAKNGEVVRDLNWRGALAQKWILSQRIDGNGAGHWDNSPEKTAFAVLLLGEL